MKTISNKIFFEQIESLLSEGEHVVIRVKGYSMRPFMRSDRTQVRITPLSDRERNDLCVGDVVLFRYRNNHIMHRIRRIEGNNITLAGDGNYRIWERCHRNDIVGKVSNVIGYGGRAVACSSRRWQLGSKAWLFLHPFMRRIILGVLWRLGYK